jgi:hypothetical protein
LQNVANRRNRQRSSSSRGLQLQKLFVRQSRGFRAHWKAEFTSRRRIRERLTDCVTREHIRVETAEECFGLGLAARSTETEQQGCHCVDAHGSTTIAVEALPLSSIISSTIAGHWHPRIVLAIDGFMAAESDTECSRRFPVSLPTCDQLAACERIQRSGLTTLQSHTLHSVSCCNCVGCCCLFLVCACRPARSVAHPSRRAHSSAQRARIDGR